MNKNILVILLGIFVILIINNNKKENFSQVKCSQSTCSNYCRSKNSNWYGNFVSPNSCQCYNNKSRNKTNYYPC